MTDGRVTVLTAPRLPELWRKVCVYSGVPTGGGASAPGHVVVRCGSAPPDLLAMLLEEALAAEKPEILTAPAEHEPQYEEWSGRWLVRPGFDAACPEGLRRALCQAAELGDILVYAVERRDARGGLLRRTWVAMPDELPVPEVSLAAAVASEGG